jgi:hypothetical protein
MKTLRMLSATGALLLAFGAAMASKLAFTYYRYDPTIPACIPHSYPFECVTAINDNPCTILFEGDQVQLRENQVVANQCGASVFKKP